MNGLKQFRNEPNPIVHQLELTPVDYIVSFVLGIVLVPIRLILVLAVMIVAWIGALIFTSNRFKNKEGEPNSKLRLKTYEIFLKLIAWISGLIIAVDGEEASKEDCPIFVAASHSTFFDAFVIPFLGMPIVLSREENKAIPFMGRLLILGQCIFLKREDLQSKQLAAKGITDWLENSSRPGLSQTDQKLLIFPEGYNTNRKALLPFKTGAFRSGKPVQPVLVQYPNRIDTVTWTWSQSHSATVVTLLTLSRPYTRVSVQILPPYYPTEEEKSDIKLYSENVRQYMSKCLGIPCCSMTSQEVQELRNLVVQARMREKLR